MRSVRMVFLAVLFAALPVCATEEPANLNQAIDKIISRENALVGTLRFYTPIIETYVQKLRVEQSELVPAGDRYFLSRAKLDDGIDLLPFRKKRGRFQNLSRGLDGVFSIEFLPRGFLQFIYLDADHFDRDHYQFEYIRRDFLGEVRCLVFDVRPRTKSDKGRFLGRIWAEDQGDNIVRFNGIYTGRGMNDLYFHFDSWRVNVVTDLWLPALIYSEEQDRRCCGFWIFKKHVRFKAQSRLWGYKGAHTNLQAELGRVLVEAPTPVRDQAEAANDFSPVEELRAWEQQSENNVIERLERFGLLAPRGDVDKILETVVNNLEVTNNLNLQPDVRCRVLLTSTLESFTIGHTIVLSRGLIDVLPDEATLALLLAHELAHIVLGHHVNTNFAFVDRVLFEQTDAFRHFTFSRPIAEEEAAARRADELLKNSPYQDALGNARKFSEELQIRASTVPNLVSPHLGNRVPVEVAMQTTSIPLPQGGDSKQVAALPVGGRIKLDPWTNSIEMIKARPVGVMFEREKMPLEVTPFFLYLRRRDAASAQKNVAIAEQPAVRQQPQ